MTDDRIGTSLERIVKDSRDGYWVIDQDGRTIYVNARAAELLGRTPEQMAGLNVLDVLDPVGREQFRIHLFELRERGPNPVDAECHYRTPEGELVRLMVGESELRDDDGQLIGYVHRMIADSRRLQFLDELRKSQSLLADAQAIAHLGSWEYDVTGDSSAWSSQMYEILGLDPATTAPSVSGFFDLVVPQDHDKLAAQFEALQHDPAERSSDARIERPDGTIRWVRATGRALAWSDDGRALRVGGTVQDIDAHKQTELQLRDSVVLNTLMQFMATAANQAATLQEAMVTLRDLLLAHPDWSRADAFDVVGGRLVATDLPDAPVVTQRHVRAAERALETKDVCFDEVTEPEHPLIAFPVLVRGEPRVVGVITARTPFERQGMLRSMAEQVAAQLATVAMREEVSDQLSSARDAAMDASQAKSEFVATMSHEIRTPLNGVLGLNELLLRTELDERQQQLAQGMRGAGQALLGLINDILDFSKIEAGALELEQLPFAPAELTREVVELFRPAAEARGDRLSVEIGADVPAVLVGDPGRFRQVLSNLVSNAVKFTGDGEVSVTVEAVPGQGQTTLRVTVEDSGVGMDPGQLERAFEPFRQADVSTTRDFGGTGLGLAIARQLALALGGELGADSTPGVGSRFWFTGNFQHDHGGGADETEPAREPGATRQHSGHVLVVEDNETNQLVALGMLEVLGFTAEVATDGAQGARMALDGDFDVVLMDLQMPGTDGFEGARLIRSGEEPGRRIPLIALTASTTDDVRTRCVEAGMDGFLTKPLSLHLLESELVRLVGASRTVRGPAPVHHPGATFDTSRLDELAELGPAAEPLIRRAADNFIGGVDERVDRLRRHASEADVVALRSEAHALKGSAANLGAVEVADLAARIEAAAPQVPEQPERVALLLDQLEEAVAHGVAALRRHPLLAEAPAVSDDG